MTGKRRLDPTEGLAPPPAGRREGVRVPPWAAALTCAVLLAGCTDPTPPARSGAATVASTTAAPAESFAGALKGCIVGHWTHAFEEDHDDLTVYWPATSQFPPARGRDGVEFRASGRLTYENIAPADGVEKTPGRWTLDGDRIRIDLDPEGSATMDMQVISCDAAALVVRR
ncbi:MAG: hypothetical protein JWN06_3748 [Propionibacteriaceae bacterium]|nr:hypothetical protein [Propionibacteriaceae bacterium]